MDIKKSRKLYIVTIVLSVALVLVIIKTAFDTVYRIKLPELPDLQGMALPLQEQISEASEKARLRPTADNIGNLGMVYHSSAWYDKAAEAYKLAVRRDKSEWIWHYYLGFLNQEMGEATISIENFRNAIKINDNAFHAWYYVGKGYQNLGENYKAEIAFNHIMDHPVKNSPGNSSVRSDYFPLRIHAMYNLSRIYLGTKRADLAEQTLREILNFHRSFGPAYRLLGDVYKQKGDQVQSGYYITRANDLVDLVQPVDTLIDKLALMSRSDIYILKQIDEAERTIYPEWSIELTRSALKYYPEDKNLISKAVKILLKLDNGNEAHPFLNKHIGLYKDDFKELKEIADLLAEKAFPLQAMIYYNQALNLEPENFDARLGLVSCLWNTGMNQDVMDQVNDLLKKNEGKIKNETEIVSMLIRMGEKGKAAKCLSGMSRTSPNDPGVLKLTGMLAESDGDLQKARTYYTAALKKAPEDFPAIKYLGNILIRQGLWSETIGHFKKSLEQYPNNPYLLERLGTLLVSCPDPGLRNYKDGREYSERAFINNGCPTETLIASGKSLAEAYSGLGDINNARTFMNITINLAKSENYPSEYIANLQSSLDRLK